MSHDTESGRLPIRASAVFTAQGARPTQEDHALVVHDKRIFTVADGFGGAGPGASAAKTACEAVKSFLFREAGDLEATLPFELRSYYSLVGNVLFNALVHANRQVLKLNRDKTVHERGGASLVAGFMDGDLLALANVGGCTGWLMRAGCEHQLATPRTYSRLCDPFEMEQREEWQIPLMALGLSEDLEPEIFECKVRPGDWVLLHTDGLHPLVREQVLKLQTRALAEGMAPEEQSRAAVRLLESVEYRDNATVALVSL
jgi:serine/threonine protein phosphatase PrpC